MGQVSSFRASRDRELIRRLQAGEEGAVSDLAREYGTRIHRLALRHLRNAEDAEEVTQDVLLKTVEKIGDFRGDAALSSWLHRITFNAAISRLRHRRVTRAGEAPGDAAAFDPGDDAGTLDIADWTDMADETILRRQMRQRLVTAVRSLPAIYRAPVILRDLHGMSTEEASSVLQVNDQTLKSRLHRGRRLLRRQLSDFAGGLILHRVAS